MSGSLVTLYEGSEQARSIKISGDLSDAHLMPLFTEEWTGSQIWAGSLFLANWIMKEDRSPVRLALELGCGTGILSILAVILGIPMIATDMPCLMDLVQNNAKTNLSTAELSRFHCFPLVWGTPDVAQLFTKQQLLSMDQIFLADCINNIYGTESVIHLASTLSEIQSKVRDHLEITMVYESRGNDELFQTFVKAMKTKGFSCSLRASLPPNTPLNFPTLQCEPSQMTHFTLHLYSFHHNEQ